MWKSLGWLILLLLIPALGWWYYPSDFGSRLPPEMPASVPVVGGEMVKSSEELFETGKGYILEIRTPDTLQKVVAFYKDRFTANGYELTFSEAVSESPELEQMVIFEARQATHTVMTEVVWNGKLSYVTTAVHMNKWILP